MVKKKPTKQELEYYSSIGGGYHHYPCYKCKNENYCFDYSRAEREGKWPCELLLCGDYPDHFNKALKGIQTTLF